MTNYRDMYFKLFVSTGQAIDELQKSLLKAEEQYIASPDLGAQELSADDIVRPKIVLDKAAVGENIRRLRHKYSMSTEQMAAIMGISPAFVGLIERGNRGASLNRLCIIANYFDVSLDSLLTPPDKPEER